MVAMTAPLRRETGDHHVRPERTDDSNNVRKDHLPIPDSQGLLRALREPKVNRPCKELLASIQPPGRQEFLGPKDSQLIAKFGAKHILPPVPSRHGKICCPVRTATG